MCIYMTYTGIVNSEHWWLAKALKLGTIVKTSFLNSYTENLSFV